MGLSELIHSGFTKRQASSMLASAPAVDTTALVAKATATTKGDLFAATAAGVIARFGVGTNGQVLTVDTSTASGLKYAAPPAAPGFRGAWTGLSTFLAYDFADGTIPGVFTTGGVTAVSNINTDVGAPAYAKNAGFDGNQQTSHMALTVPAGITAVRFWSHSTSADAGRSASQFLINGTPAKALGVWAWVQNTYAVTPGQVLRWESWCSGTWGGAAYLYVAHVELLAPTVPYMIGDAATYAGSLFVSEADNNGSTPGADANWTKLLIGTAP